MESRSSGGTAAGAEILERKLLRPVYRQAYLYEEKVPKWIARKEGNVNVLYRVFSIISSRPEPDNAKLQVTVESIENESKHLASYNHVPRHTAALVANCIPSCQGKRENNGLPNSQTPGTGWD